MAKEQLSDKQQQILEFIKRRILDKGYPPAVREICEAVNLRSTSSVHSHLETLEREKDTFIEILPSLVRSRSPMMILIWLAARSSISLS